MQNRLCSEMDSPPTASFLSELLDCSSTQASKLQIIIFRSRLAHVRFHHGSLVSICIHVVVWSSWPGRLLPLAYHHPSVASSRSSCSKLSGLLLMPSASLFLADSL